MKYALNIVIKYRSVRNYLHGIDAKDFTLDKVKDEWWEKPSTITAFGSERRVYDKKYKEFEEFQTTHNHTIFADHIPTTEEEIVEMVKSSSPIIKGILEGEHSYSHYEGGEVYKEFFKDVKIVSMTPVAYYETQKLSIKL